MDTLHSFRDVIATWPSRKDFAADVGVSVAAVNKMHETDSIRGVYFHRIVNRAKARFGDDRVTAEDLCRLAARKIEPIAGDKASGEATA